MSEYKPYISVNRDASYPSLWYQLRPQQLAYIVQEAFTKLGRELRLSFQSYSQKVYKQLSQTILRFRLLSIIQYSTRCHCEQTSFISCKDISNLSYNIEWEI